MGVLFCDLTEPTFVRYEDSGHSHLGTLVKLDKDFRIVEREDLGILNPDVDNFAYRGQDGRKIDIIHAIIGDVIVNGFERFVQVHQISRRGKFSILVTRHE